MRKATEKENKEADEKPEPLLPLEEKGRLTQTTRPARKGRQANYIKMADVEAEEVAFLWDPYLPIGKLTLLEGDPGVGKTFLALQVAAAISAGDALPGPDGIPAVECEPGCVLYMSAEDGLADTLRPRLDKMGADPRNVYCLTGWKNEENGKEGTITLQDVDVIEKALIEIKPVFLVIDPLQGYLGAKVDMYRPNETRPIMSRLAALAERYKTALLCIRHLTKAPTNRAIYRGMGSIDFSAAARSILLAGQDPEESSKRVLLHLKSATTAAGASIGFELNPEGFFWTGLSDLTKGDILRPESYDEDKSALNEAVEFLEAVLANGPVSCKHVFAEAKDLGIAEMTLRRAKNKLKVKSVKESDRWTWKMLKMVKNEHLEK